MLTGTKRSGRVLAASLLLLATAAAAAAQTITTPKQHFGFNIGDDYQLATYTQFVDYWQKLDKESDRMKVVEIGKTAEGRPQLMAIITSPENHKKLERYKEISRKLATAEGLTDDQARALAKEGKGVVWFDGGLHATEVLGAHQLIETVYQLVSRSDAETTRFLNDLVILAVHANPDGMELVSSWYMRESEPTRRSAGGLPRLYQKYIGHDNNRDFYMSTQPESTNMNRTMYIEWFPQIMYNHHQTGPAGTVMFAPPFRDPFNYNFDPLIPAQLDLVAAAMHSRFASEGKPGVTSRKGASYSTWWNGGLRTMAYFHNMIGLLDRDDRESDADEHSVHPVEAVAGLEPAFPDRAAGLALPAVGRLLGDGQLRGLRHRVAQQGELPLQHLPDGEELDRARQPRQLDGHAAPDHCGAGGARRRPGRPRRRRAGWRRARCRRRPWRPRRRFARGFQEVPARSRDARPSRFHPSVRPARLPDGDEVRQRAHQDRRDGSSRDGRVHRGGQELSRPVPTSSSPRRHSGPTCSTCSSHRTIPTTFPILAARRRRPYDSAGWTLAYQMGVKVDRILDGFDGAFEKLNGLQKPAPGKVTTTAAAGYTFSHAVNDSFTAINRLLASRGRGLLDVVGAAAGDVLRRDEGIDRGGRRQDCGRPGAQLRGRVGAGRLATPSSCESFGSRWPISTAVRCLRAGRAGCSSSSSSPSRSSFRRRSTPGTWPAAST